MGLDFTAQSLEKETAYSLDKSYLSVTLIYLN
jgi:hypothetical protein